jgi:hypothetical protein
MEDCAGRGAGVGQADAVAVEVVDVFTLQDQVHRAGAEACATGQRVALGLEVVDFLLGIQAANAEVAELGTQRRTEFGGVVGTGDYVTGVDVVIADTEVDRTERADTGDTQRVTDFGVARNQRGAQARQSRITFTRSVGGVDGEATQARRLIRQVVVEADGRAGQADRVVVPAVAGGVSRSQRTEHRGVLTTHADGTEATLQTDPGLTSPERGTGGDRAGIRRQAMLDVEDALQAAAEFFRTADGEPRTAPHAVRHTHVAVDAVDVRVNPLQRLVDTAVQHDVGLRVRNCGQSCRNGQREKRFLH